MLLVWCRHEGHFAIASRPPPSCWWRRLSVRRLLGAGSRGAAACGLPVPSVASIREVMNSVIDPSVDEVWNAVRTEIERRKG